jgi:hypothetical protein
MALPCSGIHLETADGLKGLTVMDDVRFALSFRPTQSEHIETWGAIKQMVLLQIIQGEAREPALLGMVHGRRGAR